MYLHHCKDHWKYTILLRSCAHVHMYMFMNFMWDLCKYESGNQFYSESKCAACTSGKHPVEHDWPQPVIISIGYPYRKPFSIRLHVSKRTYMYTCTCTVYWYAPIPNHTSTNSRRWTTCTTHALKCLRPCLFHSWRPEYFGPRADEPLGNKEHFAGDTAIR